MARPSIQLPASMQRTTTKTTLPTQRVSERSQGSSVQAPGRASGRIPSAESISLTISEIPPSTNKLYQRRRGGQLALTEEAQRYIQVVTEDVVSQMGAVVKLPRDPELIYRFDVFLYFESLENPGWFERWEENKYFTKDSKDGKHKKGELKARKGERKALSRYK